MGALGLHARDLYPDRQDRPRDQWRVSGGTVAAARPPLVPVPSPTEQPARRRSRAPLGPVVARYDYRDESGRVLFAKTRHEPKTFRTWGPDGPRGRAGMPTDVRRVLYRLPEVRAAIAAGTTVWVVEGEKDVERLRQIGLTATCNFDGAAKSGTQVKWRGEYGEMLAGADVVIIRDRDDAGGAHALAAFDDLSGKAASVRVVAPATGGEHDDVSDHLDAGHRIDDLVPVDPESLRPTLPERPEDEAQPTTAAPDPAPVRTGWGRVDLASILDGTYTPPVPGILYRSDGVGLFYPGLLHQVIGQPESGKSWLTLLACAARIAAGERVLFIDFESDPASVVARLLALGVDRAALLELFDYRRPEVGAGQAPAEFAEVLDGDFVLVVIDGVTDAIGLAGGSIIDNDDAGRWLRSVPERIARETGAAVVLVDHVAKSGGGSPSRYAVGAQQKLGKVRGVSYYVEPRVPIAPGQVGELTVLGTKDTAGQVKRHGEPLEREPRLWKAARVRIDATDPDSLAVEVLPPVDMDALDAISDVGERGALYERNAVLMERVSRVLETAAAEMTSSAATRRAKGNGQQLNRALAALVREGYVGQRTSGVAQLHTSEKPFREAQDPGPPPPGSTPSAPGSPAPVLPEPVPFEGVGDPLSDAADVDLQ